MIFYQNYDFSHLEQIIQKDGLIEKVIKDKTNDKYDYVYYSDTIFTLDIETTSYFITEDNQIMMFDKSFDNEFYKTTKKQALMYIWMMGIDDVVVYGRTGEQLKEFINLLNQKMIINNIVVKKIIYVHNLGFDFYFLQNWLGTHWDVFAREPNKPITAKDEHIEFRCSYFLTNMSLDNFAKNYKLKVQKQIGSLDYNIFRTPLTPLTKTELSYCEYDIKVLYEIIKYHKNIYKDLTTIPLTQTGKIRKQVNALFYKDKAHHKMIKNAAPANFEEFEQLCQVYSGGYTHANMLNANKILIDIVSQDISSSYPYECVTKKFPMYAFAKAMTNNLKEIDKEKYAFIVDFVVNDLKSKSSNTFLSISKAFTHPQETERQMISNIMIEQNVSEEEAIIIYKKSMSKNYQIVNGVFDNGRLVSCDSCRYILTDVDFKIFCNAYEWGKIKILNIYISEKDYLPVKLIKYILKLYNNKTQLKGKDEFAVKYQEIKQFLNGIYGMFVTKILQDEIIYSDGVMKKEVFESETEAVVKANERLDKYNKNFNNLNFAWGVWVSAYARQHLWRNILKLGDSVVYTDTDSIKCILTEKTKEVFKEDEQIVLKEIDAVCQHYEKDGLTKEMFSPLNKTIGLFEYEGEYNQFKTLGAKKYAYLDDDNNVHITVSGVNKKSGAKSLQSLEEFEPNHFFDYDAAGKTESYYLHEQEEVIFADGWHETARFGVCIKPTTYLLDITKEYENILNIGFSLLN